MPYRQTALTKKKKQERENSIVTAAQFLFASKGYENTTIKDIVDRAGTSVGNYYFYFQSKEDLLLAISRKINEQVFKKIVATNKKHYSGYVKIAVYIYIFTQFWYRNIEIARELLQGKFDSSARQRMFKLHREKFDEYLESTAIVKNIPVDVLISAIQGSWLNVLELYLQEKDERDPEFLAMKVIEFNLQGLGLSPEETQTTIEKIKEIVK